MTSKFWLLSFGALILYPATKSYISMDIYSSALHTHTAHSRSIVAIAIAHIVSLTHTQVSIRVLVCMCVNFLVHIPHSPWTTNEMRFIYVTSSFMLWHCNISSLHFVCFILWKKFLNKFMITIQLEEKNANEKLHKYKHAHAHAQLI